MKIKNIKFILPIMLLVIVSAFSHVYAKTSIAIKPNSTTYTRQTISDYFEACIKMKDPGESLEGSNVDVHMATNKDWAVVIYFANSSYGISGNGETSGIETQVDGRTYSSTNGNATGVMNLGSTCTYTSSILRNYTEMSDSSVVNEYGKEVIEKAEDNIHVDKYSTSLSTEQRKQQAFTGWVNTSFMSAEVDSPFCSRNGWFSYYAAVGGGNAWRSNGGPYDITFRPAIWN